MHAELLDEGVDLPVVLELRPEVHAMHILRVHVDDVLN